MTENTSTITAPFYSRKQYFDNSRKRTQLFLIFIFYFFVYLTYDEIIGSQAFLKFVLSYYLRLVTKISLEVFKSDDTT